MPSLITVDLVAVLAQSGLLLLGPLRSVLIQLARLPGAPSGSGVRDDRRASSSRSGAERFERRRPTCSYPARRCLRRQDFVAQSWPKRRLHDWLNHAAPD